MKRVSLTFVLAAMTLLVAGCHDDPPVAPAPSLTTIVPSGAVQAVIQQESVSADGSMTFVVRVLTKDVIVSSFQGAVTFAPGAFELVSAKSPNAGEAEAYLLNPAQFSNGRILFAAFTPRSFGTASVGSGTEAFRFTVRPLRPLDQANLVATLTAVGRETGVRMAADRVYASPGVHDASGYLIVR
jgi:hypothetical protein